MFLNKIKQDTNKWKNVLCSFIVRPNIVKISKKSIDAMQSPSNPNDAFLQKWKTSS